MPLNPTNPHDRIAELETAVERLRRLEERAAGWAGATERQVWPALTAEWDPDDETHPEPYPAEDDHALPIVFRDVALEPTSTSTTTTGEPPAVVETSRSEWPPLAAVSRVGWLPPGVEVWVTMDRRKWLIVEAPTHLVGVACCPIPAAAWDGSKWTLSSGTVVLYRETSPGVYEMARYADGGAVTMTWYNANPDAEIKAGPLLVAHQDADHRWVVADAPEFGTSTTAGPGTTTTTAEPGCAGRCLWTWSAGTSTWSLTSDGCAVSTTTTAEPTTSTTGGATSTTGEPGTTTTVCPPCSTTTPAPTTTTAEPCECLYPDFCGWEDGQSTRTYCGYNARNEPPGCSTTTTDTTTTCDCGTTTTPAGCGTGCDWVGLPSQTEPGVWIWSILSDDCSQAHNCTCSEPTDDPRCNTGHTDCFYRPPGPGTTPPPCIGTCTYWWIPTSGVWRLPADGNHCAGGSGNCNCQEPSYPGTGCEQVTVPCGAPASNTTTAAPIPCYHCYTTTGEPTTTAEPTTTTTSACAGGCQWEWDDEGEAWSKLADTCGGDCPCPEPPNPGEGDECTETAYTYCVGSTTTTAPPTTTTVSPTSTEAPTTTTEAIGFCCQTPGSPCLGDVTASYCQGLGGTWYANSEACVAACSVTSTTTTAEPTTTTAEPPTTTTAGCTGSCLYICDSGAWMYAGDDCSAGCDSCEASYGSCQPEEQGATTAVPCAPA